MVFYKTILQVKLPQGISQTYPKIKHPFKVPCEATPKWNIFGDFFLACFTKPPQHETSEGFCVKLLENPLVCFTKPLQNKTSPGFFGFWFEPTQGKTSVI